MLKKKKGSLQFQFSSCFNCSFKQIENMFQGAEFQVLLGFF